ncbi:MAG: hypothetical protein EOO53_09670 [Gammaproteobacteria bacterium]|nr:MAG: hypothetical protein EOO53_09670 [Gammaproteobacteria bacterium]
MFEKITFTTQDKTSITYPINIGHLVECMLFYKKTHVIADQGILKQLLNYFGVNNLLRLIELDVLDITYTDSFMGIYSQTVSGSQFHNVVDMNSPQNKYEDVLRRQCIEIEGKSGKGKRQANKIQDKINVITHDPVIIEGSTNSILSQEYVLASAKTSLQIRLKLKNIPDIEFNTENTINGIQIHTNINFLEVNEIYHMFVSPSHSTITPALILSDIMELERDLYFSSKNLSEIAASPISSELAQKKFSYIFDISKNNNLKIECFSELLFNDVKDIQNAVNSKKINLSELLDLIEGSIKFKEWLRSINPDLDLFKQYHDAITKESFFEKLPAKTVRFCIFTGLGMASDGVIGGGLGTSAGIALGSLDTFILDKLINGWKPNHFIDGKVKPLIAP